MDPYNWHLHSALHDLNKRLEELQRELHHINCRIDNIEKKEIIMTDQVDDVIQSVEQLKADLAAKFGAISQEFATIESEISDPTKLAGLKSLIGDLDSTVNSFDPAAAPAPTPDPTPDPAPTPDATEPTQPVYTFTGSEGVNPAPDQFTVSGFQTVTTDGSSPVALYYFNGDTAGSGTSGPASGTTVPGYAIYTGETAVVPAA